MIVSVFRAAPRGAAFLISVRENRPDFRFFLARRFWAWTNRAVKNFFASQSEASMGSNRDPSAERMNITNLKLLCPRPRFPIFFAALAFKAFT